METCSDAATSAQIPRHRGIQTDIERLIAEMQKSIEESDAFIRSMKS